MSDPIHGVVIVTHTGVMFILFRLVFRKIRKNFLLLRALNKAEIASNLNHFAFTDEILFTAL